MTGENKICTKCKTEKTLDQFYKKLRGKLNVSSECRECIKKRVVLSRQGKTFRTKERQYYFENTSRIQGNKCAICKTSFKDETVKACLDHDHSTNELRGILCSPCNIGLGLFLDSKDRLKSAIKYLKIYEMGKGEN